MNFLELKVRLFPAPALFPPPSPDLELFTDFPLPSRYFLHSGSNPKGRIPRLTTFFVRLAPCPVGSPSLLPPPSSCFPLLLLFCSFGVLFTRYLFLFLFCLPTLRTCIVSTSLAQSINHGFVLSPRPRTFCFAREREEEREEAGRESAGKMRERQRRSLGKRKGETKEEGRRGREEETRRDLRVLNRTLLTR